MKTLVYGSTLPPEALDCLQQNGFLTAPPQGPDQSPPGSALAGLPLLTVRQGGIWAALTSQPLNQAQTEVLAIYARARKAGEGALPVETIAARLSEATGIDPAKAGAHVRGAIRSFGRRLTAVLRRVPGHHGHNRNGEDVFDQVPSLALFDVVVGPSGEKRHRLSDDGIVAVIAALGLTEAGHAAGGLHNTGDPKLDDMDAVVMLGMSRLAAALILRVQQSYETSLDDTLKTLAAHAGAG